jgi:hypothetical protein
VTVRYKLLVKADPKPGEEAEYNRWYDTQHVPDVLQVHGFVSAERFVFAQEQMSDAPPSHRYLAIYDIETDDLAKTLEAFRREHPKMVQSPAVELADATAEIFALKVF